MPDLPDIPARARTAPPLWLLIFAAWLVPAILSGFKRLDGSRFVRVHRAAIVQLDRIRELRGDEAVLRDDSRIPVSRRRRGMVERLLRRS